MLPELNNNSIVWRPTADVNSFKSRSELLKKIRSFFLKYNVLEVETPLIAQTAATDPFLCPVKLANNNYLQTSPEYYMKRLLASGINQSIFQISKAFRDSETSVRHNIEFTMLEWYMLDYNLSKIIDQTAELISDILDFDVNHTCKITYQDIFLKYFKINPLDPINCNLYILNKLCIEHNIILSEFATKNLTKADYFDLLFSYIIQPKLPKNTVCVIYNYPEEQSALAKISQDKKNNYYANRFEIFVNNLELANGYHELTCHNEQLTRFNKDLEIRKNNNKEVIPIDYKLLAALEHGFPECSGVALGVDRLLMLKMGVEDISKVISFTSL